MEGDDVAVLSSLDFGERKLLPKKIKAKPADNPMIMRVILLGDIYRYCSIFSKQMPAGGRPYSVSKQVYSQLFFFKNFLCDLSLSARLHTGAVHLLDISENISKGLAVGYPSEWVPISHTSPHLAVFEKQRR
jgi:hypothetical protein